jgi:hypothetical protein
VIIPLFLLVGRAWRTLVGLGFSVFVLVFSSAILFGTDAWVRFFEKIPFMIYLLKNGYLQMHQVVSPLGALLLMGIPYDAAIWVHLAFSVIGISLTVVTWYKNKPGYIRHSLLVLTILLVTPYANSYDLTLLALPLCWIGWEVYKKSEISNRETFFLIAAWFLPIVSVFFAVLTGFQIAPFFILCMLIWTYLYDLQNGSPVPVNR